MRRDCVRLPGTTSTPNLPSTLTGIWGHDLGPSQCPSAGHAHAKEGVMMPYHSRAVANYFLEVAKISRKTLDPMQVQKLVYFGHGWHFAYTNNSLIDERFEAWDYGPVVPTLYHSFKKWGSGPIKAPADRMAPRVYGDANKRSISYRWIIPSLEDTHDTGDTLQFTQALLQKIWDVYGHMSGPALSQITHDHEGPWYKTFKSNPGVRGVDISNDMIREYFRKKLDDNRARTHSTTR